MASNNLQIAYLEVISYLDKLVQPSFTLSTQIRPNDTLTSEYNNAGLMVPGLPQLINGNVILLPRQEG